MLKNVPIFELLPLLRKALAAGARQITPFEFEWEISGSCLLPVRMDIVGHPRGAAALKGWVPPKPGWSMEDFPPDYLGRRFTRTLKDDIYPGMTLHMTMKCRRCDDCLKQRKLLWARRALVEQGKSNRTWFGTITGHPEWQSRWGAIAAVKARELYNEVLEALPFDEQLHLRAEAMGAEITKMFKRLRAAGHSFRYMLVLEAHESGLPHYHILLHEIGAPITKRTLDGAWSCGYTVYRLTEDAKACWYTAKYLGKTSAARVRASAKYGSVMSSMIGKSSVSRVEKPDLTGRTNVRSGGSLEGERNSSGALGGASLPCAEDAGEEPMLTELEKANV